MVDGDHLSWLKPRLWLVDLNYNFECNWLIQNKKFECDWFIELSDNKLCANNLASELVENRSF